MQAKNKKTKKLSSSVNTALIHGSGSKCITLSSRTQSSVKG